MLVKTVLFRFMSIPERIYGKDCDGGRWHKHPWNNPAKHEFTREIPLKDFLFEAYEGLKKKNIL